MYTEPDPGRTLLVFYLLYAVAALAVVGVSIRVRIKAGVSVAELARTRGYELPPLRLAIHVAHVCLWLATAYAALNCLKYIEALISDGGAAYGWGTLAAALVAGGSGFVAMRTLTHLVRIEHNPPPAVPMAGIGKREGVDRAALASLGTEQFPQMLAHGHDGDLPFRRRLLGAGAAVLLFTLAAQSEWGSEMGLARVGSGVLGLWLAVLGLLPVLPAGLSQALLLTGALGCAMLVGFNGTYTLMPFRQTLRVGMGLLALVWWSQASIADGQSVFAWTAAIGLAFSARWGYDLYRAHGFQRVRHVTEPISQGIRQAVPFLSSLRDRDDCRLPPLDDAELGRRISRGCRNVEGASLLVTRNLARFMSLVHVEHEQFAAAALRYLTVRRYVTAAGGGGTTRALQNPAVPAWNEVLFPLRPPAGYLNWLDPLGLGREWDEVSICSGCQGSGRVRCGGCGGSGRQQRVETYTESSRGGTVTRSRTVTVTCSGCGGSGQVTCSPCGGLGRVVFYRTLNTQWQRLLPACTAPYTLLPEFMEEAEERTYFRLPLVENRMPLPPRPVHDGIGPDLEVRLTEAVGSMSASLPQYARMVQQLHDGVIYRADFQVTGFQVLRIGFERLKGRVGWFFGKRPEFYFPVLPLSWSMVGTVLFVGPFLVMTALLGLAVARSLFHALLPGIY